MNNVKVSLEEVALYCQTWFDLPHGSLKILDVTKNLMQWDETTLGDYAPTKQKVSGLVKLMAKVVSCLIGG